MKIIVVTPQKHGTQNLVQMTRRMLPCMYQGSMKRFMTHIIRLSGESRAASQAGLKCLERVRKGHWLGFYCGYRVGLEWGFLGRARACVIWTSWDQGRVIQAFLSACLVWGKRGRGRIRAWKIVSKHQKWSQTLYHKAIFLLLIDNSFKDPVNIMHNFALTSPLDASNRVCQERGSACK